VLGGQTVAWNTGLSGGIGSFSIATGLIGLGYLCLCMSLAEMSSCLQVPFAGGSFFFGEPNALPALGADNPLIQRARRSARSLASSSAAAKRSSTSPMSR
jgi:amino acid transporter